MARFEQWTTPALQMEEKRLADLLKRGTLNDKAQKNVNRNLTEVRAALQAAGHVAAEAQKSEVKPTSSPIWTPPSPAVASSSRTPVEAPRAAGRGATWSTGAQLDQELA